MHNDDREHRGLSGNTPGGGGGGNMCVLSSVSPATFLMRLSLGNQVINKTEKKGVGKPALLIKTSPSSLGVRLHEPHLGLGHVCFLNRPAPLGAGLCWTRTSVKSSIF